MYLKAQLGDVSSGWAFKQSPCSRRHQGGFILSSLTRISFASSCIPPNTLESCTGFRKTRARISNSIRDCLYLPRNTRSRWYPVLQPTALIGDERKSIETLLERFKPTFTSIDPERILCPDLRITEILTEAWAPTTERPDTVSLVYYVMAHNERHPNPILRYMYDSVRPKLFGNLHDIEAVVVRINTTTLEPVGLEYESTHQNAAYSTSNGNDLHQHVVWNKTDRGWLRNGQIANAPFTENIAMSIRAWNFSMESVSWLKEHGFSAFTEGSVQALYPIKTQPTLSSLSNDRYLAEDMSLRCGWLTSERQQLHLGWIQQR